jgi:hypothetical protein
VTPDEVALIFELQDPAAKGDLRAQFIAHRARLCSPGSTDRGPQSAASGIVPLGDRPSVAAPDLR